MSKRSRSPSPSAPNKRACPNGAGGVNAKGITVSAGASADVRACALAADECAHGELHADEVLVCSAADLADVERRPAMVAALRESLRATGLAVITDVLTDGERTNVLARLTGCFLDMFGETACVSESGNRALIEERLREGLPADALAIAAQSRAARDGHGLVGFSHFRVQPAPAESALAVDAPGHPLHKVVFTHSPVYERVNKFLWSHIPGALEAIMQATHANMVSFDAGMCRYVAPRRSVGRAALPKRAARPCGTSPPSATKFHTDTYPAELHRTQGIYFERTEGALRLAFVPGSHIRPTATHSHTGIIPAGFSARESDLLHADRATALRHAIAAPDNSIVLFAQGVIHGEMLFDTSAVGRGGLLIRPTGPFGADDKVPVPTGELAVRLVLGTHRASYAPATRAALETMAAHGLIPESIAGANAARQVPDVAANIVNRYNTQYQKRFPPSAAAAAAFDDACAALGAAPRARAAPAAAAE